MMEPILLNLCKVCDSPLVSSQRNPSFCPNEDCKNHKMTIIDAGFCFANKGDSEENMQADLLAEETMNNFTELKGLISRVGVNADCDQEDDINNLFAALESNLKQITSM